MQIYKAIDVRADAEVILKADHLAALEAAVKEKEEQHKWERSHMQTLRNGCFKIIEALHIGDSLSIPCGDKDVEAAPGRAVEQITTLRLEISDLVTEHEDRCGTASECIAELNTEIAALKATIKKYKDGLMEKETYCVGCSLPTDIAVLEEELRLSGLRGDSLDRMIEEGVLREMQQDEEIVRLRKTIEDIKTDSGNRPGHEKWEYYCQRLHSICVVADKALKAKTEV